MNYDSASVTFDTKVWEKDWRILVKGGRLEKMIDRCNFQFDHRRLLINNVDDISLVLKSCDKLINRSVIDSYIVVSNHAYEVLDFFNLSVEGLGKGYYYSIAELTSIYFCETDFLLHFASDSYPMKSHDNWVPKLINQLTCDSQIAVTNLTWNQSYDHAKSESFSENSDFYIGYGFSDQMYLIRTADFKKPIYSETNENSNHYPKYGGELFEKRVHSWMLNHEKYRATYKHLSYQHKNFSKNSLVRKLNEFIDLN